MQPVTDENALQVSATEAPVPRLRMHKASNSRASSASVAHAIAMAATAATVHPAMHRPKQQ